MRKTSTRIPTDSYLYLARQLAECMMRFNVSVCSVRMQITKAKNMNNFETSTQKIPNLHVDYLGESESKIIDA